MERWFTPGFSEGSGRTHVAKIRDIFLETDPAGYAQCCRVLANTDLSTGVDLVSAPALVLTGEDDQGTPPSAALQLATAMLAQRLAPRLRVAAVAPGLSLPSYLQSDADFARTARHSLTGEASNAQDVASAVRFLIETPSMTGSTMLVDGGQHLVPMTRDVSFL